MRQRAMDPSGDYLFGRAGAFLINSPDCVRQAIQTRLLLMTGEWFLDDAEGTPYAEEILGTGTQGTRDHAIRERILNTPGVSEILIYQSSVDTNRRMTVAVTVSTIYGNTQLTLTV